MPYRRSIYVGSFQALPTKTFHEGDIDAEDAQCVVCLEEYHEGDSYKRLPCRHHFHTSCIDEWLRLNDRCEHAQWPLYNLVDFVNAVTALSHFVSPAPAARSACARFPIQRHRRRRPPPTQRARVQQRGPAPPQASRAPSRGRTATGQPRCPCGRRATPRRRPRSSTCSATPPTTSHCKCLFAYQCWL